MKTLLSLFDYTGNWAAPFSYGGWNVVQWDIKLEDQANGFDIYGDIREASADMFYEQIFDNFGMIDGIIAAVPCTDFAVSGITMPA